MNSLGQITNLWSPGGASWLKGDGENDPPKPAERDPKEARWEDLESRTISPRARVAMSQQLLENNQKEYILADSIEPLRLQRFLINSEIEIKASDENIQVFDSECDVFERAFDYLKDAKSAKTFVGEGAEVSSLPRSFSDKLNVVLVDIFEFKHGGKKAKEEPQHQNQLDDATSVTTQTAGKSNPSQKNREEKGTDTPVKNNNNSLTMNNNHEISSLKSFSKESEGQSIKTSAEIAEKGKKSDSEKGKDLNPEKVSLKAVHTICIWKKADDELQLIDPSNDENLSRFANLPPPDWANVSIKKNIGNKFYRAFNPKQGGYEGQNGYECNKDSRDCIDIAVKIASSLIWSQLSALTVSSIENRLNYLSNQKKVNKLINTDNEAHIGWLQNWSPIERDEVRHLLIEHESYLPLVDIGTIQDLRWLAKARFNPGFELFFKEDLKEVKKIITSSIPCSSFEDFLTNYCRMKGFENQASAIQKEANKIKGNLLASIPKRSAQVTSQSPEDKKEVGNGGSGSGAKAKAASAPN